MNMFVFINGSKPPISQCLMNYLLKRDISKTFIYLIIYPTRWSVWGRTNKDFPESSHALHKAAALSEAITSSPVDTAHEERGNH